MNKVTPRPGSVFDNNNSFTPVLIYLLADLSIEPGSKIPQGPVIVHIRSHTQLFAYNACCHCWDKLM